MPSVDDDVPDDCPLCLEEMDLSDKHFRPCVCGYQICHFCWHHIREELNGLCPACRRPYSEEGVQFTPISAEELSKSKKKKGKEKPKEPEKAEKSREAAEVPKKQLSSLRVMQRTLVYVIGIPLKIATEETLRSQSYFGQYGKIVKIIVNKRNVHTSSQQRAEASPITASAYITFDNANSAALAIQAVDGTWLDNCLLRASFGTTKYCANFLRGISCTNPDCLYLHELMDKESTFTREEMAQGKHQLRFGAPVEFGKREELPEPGATPATRGERSSEVASRSMSAPDSSSRTTEESGSLPKTASWARVASSQEEPKAVAPAPTSVPDTKARSPSPPEAQPTVHTHSTPQPAQPPPQTQSPSKATAKQQKAQAQTSQQPKAQQQQQQQQQPPTTTVLNDNTGNVETVSSESQSALFETIPAYNPLTSNYSLVSNLSGIISSATQHSRVAPAPELTSLPMIQSQPAEYDPFFHRTFVQPQYLGERSRSPQPLHSLWNQPTLLESVQGILVQTQPATQKLTPSYSKVPSDAGKVNHSRFAFGREEPNGFSSMDSESVGVIESLLDEPSFPQESNQGHPSSSAPDLSQKWTPLGLPPTAFQSWSSNLSGAPPSSSQGLWQAQPSSQAAPQYSPTGPFAMGLDSHLFSGSQSWESQGGMFGPKLPQPDAGFAPSVSLSGPEGALWSFGSHQPPPASWTLAYGGQSRLSPLSAGSSLPGEGGGEENRFPPGSRFSSHPAPSPRDSVPNPLLKLRDLSRSPPSGGGFLPSLFPEHHLQSPRSSSPSQQPFSAPTASRPPQQLLSFQQQEFFQGLSQPPPTSRSDPFQFPFGSLQKQSMIDAWDDQGEGSNVTHQPVLQTPFSIGGQSRDLSYLQQLSRPGPVRLSDDDDFDLEYSRVAEEFMSKLGSNGLPEGGSSDPYTTAPATYSSQAPPPSRSKSPPRPLGSAPSSFSTTSSTSSVTNDQANANGSKGKKKKKATGSS